MKDKYNLNEEEIAITISEIIMSKSVDRDDALKEWYCGNAYSESFIETLQSHDLKDRLKKFKRDEKFSESLKLKNRIARLKRRKLLIRTSSITAIIVFIFFMIRWIEKPREQEPILAQKSIEKPVLILESGETILLDSVDRVKYVNEENAYSITYDKNTDTNRKEELNTIIMPSENIYTVILSDGTKVILNANSKLTYPVSFDKNVRSVILEGEAYFDVVKSDVPFLVKSNDVLIKVYGTIFNINSYDIENIEVVLVTGKVGVSYADNEQLLLPNQYVTINENSGIGKVTDVHSSDYILWVQGQIKSYNSELGNLIDKFKYWYGLEIYFMNDDKRFIPINASFDNNQSFEEIIPTIEFSTGVEIRKEKGGYMIY